MISDYEMSLIENAQPWLDAVPSAEQTPDQAIRACAFSWCHVRQIEDGVSLDPLEVAQQIRDRVDAGS